MRLTILAAAGSFVVAWLVGLLHSRARQQARREQALVDDVFAPSTSFPYTQGAPDHAETVAALERLRAETRAPLRAVGGRSAVAGDNVPGLRNDRRDLARATDTDPDAVRESAPVPAVVGDSDRAPALTAAQAELSARLKTRSGLTETRYRELVRKFGADDVIGRDQMTEERRARLARQLVDIADKARMN